MAKITMADATLDVRGLRCPLPILKAKRAIMTVPPGGLLEVLATDTGALEDFQAFAAATGHGLVEYAQMNGVWRFVLRRASGNSDR